MIVYIYYYSIIDILNKFDGNIIVNIIVNIIT